MSRSDIAEREDSIPALLLRNARIRGKKPANREKEFGIWQCWTWDDVACETRSLALGFMRLGMQPGDHVAVIGRNRPKLYWSMLAVQMNGAIPVPVYQDAVADEMSYVLDHCGARIVIAGDQEQVDKVLETQDRLPKLERIVYLDPRGMRKYDHSRMHDWHEVQAEGAKLEPILASELESRIEALNSDSTCVMLYTSGTTGNPKGVVLSNRNIISASKASAEFDKLSDDDSVLAYLPMAWVGDYIFSIGQAYCAGFCVNCPESAHTMLTDLREIGPTYYFAPPRIFENMLTQIVIRMEDAGKLKKRMFDFFVKHARKTGPRLMSGESVSPGDRMLYKLGDLLVYGPLRNALGLTKVRVGYTAGEAIGPEIFEFYRSIGINLKQLYGQTEASVFITQQPDGEVRPDTVGVPTPGVEVKTADDGEVMYRSPGSFVEYYCNPEATASTKDADGWVVTGDAGFFDSQGHLRIIDRSKDVGKMQDGRMFAPKYVENKLKFYSNILEAVVFGADREYCAAVINIDLTAVGNWAERNSIVYSSYQELASHPQVYEIMRNQISAINQSLAEDEMLAGCQIRRFLILHKELDADDGELTRTRKVRRRFIESKYKDLIDALYSDRESVHAETEVTYEDGRKGTISATLRIADAPGAAQFQKKVA